MPRGDKTGSDGAGPMTGRAAGYCAGYSVLGCLNLIGGYGRGFGRGWGRGFGRRRFVYLPPAAVQPVYQATHIPVVQPQAPEQEIAALENYQKRLEAEKTELEQEMGSVKSRIEELKSKTKK